MGIKEIIKNILILFFANSSIAQEYKISEEYIQPLKYPKFSISVNYNINRNFHGFADKNLRFKFAQEFGGSLAFEAGLYKYFNAGAQLTFNIPGQKNVPIQLRLALFAKPYLPLGERLALFARIAAGISASQGDMKSWLMRTSPLIAAPKLKEVYGDQVFFGTAFGGNALIGLGIEYFPWPLLGFALESGFRAEIWRERGLENLHAPKNFNYLTSEFPLTATVHIIL